VAPLAAASASRAKRRLVIWRSMTELLSLMRRVSVRRLSRHLGGALPAVD
jgi:hypothetical protein